jgi:hypothetical protein
MIHKPGMAQLGKVGLVSQLLGIEELISDADVAAMLFLLFNRKKLQEAFSSLSGSSSGVRLSCRVASP